MIKISPSMLAADFSRLGEELDAVQKGGADMLHVDVMDAHFVPNLSFGMPVMSSIRKITDLFFDVHIMISQPQKYISALKAAGADMITFHYEAEGDPAKTLAMIKEEGLKAGIAIKPGTDVSKLLPLQPLADLVLVMTVEPGFGGQKFMSDMMPKVEALYENRLKLGLKEQMIQVDGGIDRTTIALAAAAGADCFVAGSAVFGKKDYAHEIDSLRTLACEACRG